MFKSPATPLGQFLFFFAMECIGMAVICASTRAQAAGSYGWTASTSLFYGTQTWGLAKMFNEDAGARTGFAGAGMILGGLIGDLVSIWLTKKLFGF